MLPLSTQFAPRSVPVLPLSTEPLIELNDRYRVKLELERRRVHTNVTEIVSRISHLCTVCAREEKQAADIILALKDCARKLAARYDADCHKIIGDQLFRATSLVENEKGLRMRVARTEAHNLAVCARIDCDTAFLDQEIAQRERECERAFAPELVATMRQIYQYNLSNIDYEAAQLVRLECKDKWLPGLK